MGLDVPDGIYSIHLANNESCITDPGEGRFLNLLQPGTLGDHAHKIKIQYNPDKGAYIFQFERSGKYLTFEGEPTMNNKLMTGDKPRYFKITRHEYYPDKFIITSAEDKQFHVGMAMERIYPPWVSDKVTGAELELIVPSGRPQQLP